MAKRILKHLVLVFMLASGAMAFLMASAGNAVALNLGTNITINDGISPATGTGVGKEDNECEPNMVQSQVWDLEGFFLAGKQLSIVGGYNFYTGVSDGSKYLKAGDIFIDINGDAIHSPNTIPGYNYDPGYKTVSNGLFKYDYVLDVDWANGTYSIVKLNSNSLVQDTEYGSAWNKPSNPWKYDSGGQVLANNLSFNPFNKAKYTDAATGFDGWDRKDMHYVATFDLGTYVDLTKGALFHNTMECGNDNLIGQSAPEPVPEPSTCLLVGLGVATLVAVRRRQRR